jgi:hypothetical protein
MIGSSTPAFASSDTARTPQKPGDDPGYRVGLAPGGYSRSNACLGTSRSGRIVHFHDSYVSIGPVKAEPR